jgi:hypothetical protein
VNPDLSRRRFLAGSAWATGAALVAVPKAHLRAAAELALEGLEGAGFRILNAAEVAALSAIADQIWPPDDTPGGAALGAVHFMDAAFDGFMAGALPLVRSGLPELDRRAGELGSPDGTFAGLRTERQTELLQSIEHTPLFATLHQLVIWGLFALPQYGGNRNHGAWQAIGFERRHHWQPPFGYYDAQVQRDDDEHA